MDKPVFGIGHYCSSSRSLQHGSGARDWAMSIASWMQNRTKEPLLVASLLIAAPAVAQDQAGNADQRAQLQMLQNQIQYLEMQARQEDVLQQLRTEQRLQQQELQRHIQDGLREQQRQTERLQTEQRMRHEAQRRNRMTGGAG